MNYKAKLIASAFILGLGLSAKAQESSKFTLNGLGRSIITNNNLGGEITENDETFQQSAVSGYNLFDLQTNLNVDSSFQAMAILRAKSPFGAMFGQGTTFEFRQFTMMGELAKFKYEIGDIRVELSPYTVFNNDLYQHNGYESELFTMRRDIIEYENFNQGNTWLLQGLAGEYFFRMNDEGMGLGIYAFTSRNTPTNETTIPDRLLSGGNLEFRFNESIAIGSNVASLYDITLLNADFDYQNNVFTGYAKYKYNSSKMYVDAIVEGGMSSYTFTQEVDDQLDPIDSAYTDGFVDVTAVIGLKKQKVKFDVNFRSVGVLFSSPSAQTRRIIINNPLNLFTTVKNDAQREQLLYDRFTSEDVYNAVVTPNLMAFLPYYNNASPYGKATPNRIGGEFGFSTDTSNKNIEAGVRFAYFTEIQGEGLEDKRTFMVINGGGIAHVGKYLDINRRLDINAGARFEQTNRTNGAPVELNSLLIDAGISFEVVKRLDILAGAKFFSASGNEFIGVRNGFNAIESFEEIDIDMAENIISFGLRARFNQNQMFTINYNLTNFDNSLAPTSNYNLGQLFLNYTGKF